MNHYHILGKAEMKRFLKEIGSCSSASVVRTKINNERKKREEDSAKRLKKLGLEK